MRRLLGPLQVHSQLMVVRLTILPGGTITTVNYPQTWTGNFAFAGSNALNLGAGAVTMNASCQTTISASTLTIGGTIAGSAYNLTKAGSGILAFGSNNISLTNLAISAGTLTSTSGTMNLAGNFSNSGTFASNSGTVALSGTSPQTVGGTIASTFNNLTINNSSGVSLNQSALVAGTLTLTSGTVTTSTNSLTITSAGTISGASSASYIIGTLALTLPTNIATDGTTYSFPVGEIGNYCPLSLVNIRTGATAPVVQVIENATGASTGDGTTITSVGPRNWYIKSISGNFTSSTIQLTQSGLIPTNVIGQSAGQSGNYVSMGGTNIGASVTSIQAATLFPVYFAIGISAIKALYSYQSGNWDSTTTWTTDPSGTLWQNARVPGTMDKVIILNGRTISITSNDKNVTTLTLNAGGILDIGTTTGHNFGTVAGQGNLRIDSNTLPAGTYTSFVAPGGGTIEFYNLNNVSLPTSQPTYNNLIISFTANAYRTYINNVNSSGTATNLTVNGNFSLQNNSTGADSLYFGNWATPSDSLINMTVYGNFTVGSGCYIRVSNFHAVHTTPPATTANNTTVYPIHSLYLYGNFTNNGSVRFTGLPSPVNVLYYTLATTAYPAGGTNYGDVQVYFMGTTNNTMACNGTTDLYRLIVAKGSDNTYTLEVTSSDTNNFALCGPDNQGDNTFDGGPDGYGYGAYYKALFIHYGILKLDTNINIPSLTEGGQDFNLVPTAELWINGAHVSVTVPGFPTTGTYSYQAATLYGYLRISAGEFSTGDAAGIVLGTLGTPTIRIERTGVLDASNAWENSGGTNLMSYIQTGGTANFRLKGEDHAGPMLGLNNPNSSFVMSGGTINFVYNKFVDSTAEDTIMDIEPQSGYYQVTGGTVNINVPASATSYLVRSSVPLYNLNISNASGTGTTTIQWNTPSPNLNVLNNLTINNNAVLNLSANSLSLLVGGNFAIASGGTYMPGTGDTTSFDGSAQQAFTNIGTVTGGLSNLAITNSSTTTIVSNGVTVNGTLTIGPNSVLNDSGQIVTVIGNIINSGVHMSRVSAGGITLSGTAAQTISGNGSGVFNNLTLSKTGGSVAAASDMTVTGNLRLAGATAGAWNIINIAGHKLSLGTNAMVYSDMGTGDCVCQ